MTSSVPLHPIDLHRKIIGIKNAVAHHRENLAIPRIHPTIAPFLPSSACSAAICKSKSTVNFNCFPGSAGVSSNRLISRPWLFISRGGTVLPHQDAVVLFLHSADAHYIAGL